MAGNDCGVIFVIILIFFALYASRNQSEEFVNKALGKWKVVYVNAQWTTQECEEIVFEKPTAADKEKVEGISFPLEWDKIKLKFIQDGAELALLLENEMPGVFTSVPVVFETGDLKEDELSSFQYLFLGDDNFMVVNDLNAAEVGFHLLLAREETSLDQVKRRMETVGVTVVNATGCVKRHDHEEL